MENGVEDCRTYRPLYAPGEGGGQGWPPRVGQVGDEFKVNRVEVYAAAIGLCGAAAFLRVRINAKVVWN